MDRLSPLGDLLKNKKEESYNENFILYSTRIFMKAFHLLLFDGSFIFPKCILIFGLILLLMIYSTSDQKDISWFYFISSTSLEISKRTISTKSFNFLFYYVQHYLLNVSVYDHIYYLEPRNMYGLMRLLRYIYSWVGQALLFWFMVFLGYMVHPGERSSFKKL
ncbi:hypothetical protein Lal_00031559 [Lupinus albus]|nr:hypothetical protein Lal_00031559 [Lupinus albus]